MPGHKSMKDIIMLVCANTSGDCKIKPMLFYHSENQRILMRNNVMKSKLPVMWQSSPKSWRSRHFFVEWVYEAFGPQVKEYVK